MGCECGLCLEQSRAGKGVRNCHWFWEVRAEPCVGVTGLRCSVPHMAQPWLSPTFLSPLHWLEIRSARGSVCHSVGAVFFFGGGGMVAIWWKVALKTSSCKCVEPVATTLLRDMVRLWRDLPEVVLRVLPAWALLGMWELGWMGSCPDPALLLPTHPCELWGTLLDLCFPKF